MTFFKRAGRAFAPLPLLFVGKAFSLATHVIPEADLATRVPLTELADFTKSLDDGPVHTAGFDVSRTGDYALLANGRDKSGKTWKLALSAATHELWVTKASPNRTYFFAGHTGGAGMAPTTFVAALSFDPQGKPVPFCIRGFQQYGHEGIQDLVDLDGTGPELIEQEWVETHDVPETRSGYYVTTLYQQRGVYWYRADGRHGAKTFPLFERWRMLPDSNSEEVPAPPESKDWVHNYDNDPRSGGTWSCESWVNLEP